MNTKPSVIEDALSLGRHIHAARSERGWSLAEVARRTGLSRAYINALERGRSVRPSAQTLRKLEDALGLLGQTAVIVDAKMPVGLSRLADERGLPESEVRMLAGLRVRGRQPESPERWRFIYDALVASEAMELKPPKRRDS